MDPFHPPTYQALHAYRLPRTWSPGASFLKRALWRLAGQPLLASHLPGTGWRKQLLVLFGARFGQGGCLKPHLHITFPWRLVVGSHCWLGEHLWIDNLGVCRA